MTFTPEQIARQKIDKKLEKAGWVVEQLGKTIVENLQKTEAMQQSILENVFRGGVSQIKNYIYD